MRVTVDRKFTIQADLTVAGVTAKCATTATLSGSAYPGGSLSGNEKYDRLPVVEDGGTAAEADLYLKNDQMKLVPMQHVQLCQRQTLSLISKELFQLFKLNMRTEVLQTIMLWSMNLHLLIQ